MSRGLWARGELVMESKALPRWSLSLLIQLQPGFKLVFFRGAPDLAKRELQDLFQNQPQTLSLNTELRGDISSARARSMHHFKQAGWTENFLGATFYPAEALGILWFSFESN